MPDKDQNKTAESNPVFTINWILPIFAPEVSRMTKECGSFKDFLALDGKDDIINQTSLCYIEITKASENIVKDLMMLASSVGPAIKPFISENKIFFTYDIAMQMSNETHMFSDENLKNIDETVINTMEEHDATLRKSDIYIEAISESLLGVKLTLPPAMIGLILSLNPFFWCTTSSQTFSSKDDAVLIGYTDDHGMSMIHSIAKTVVTSDDFSDEIKKGAKLLVDTLDKKIVKDDKNTDSTEPLDGDSKK